MPILKRVEPDLPWNRWPHAEFVATTTGRRVDVTDAVLALLAVAEGNPAAERGAVTPAEIVKWLRGRTGAHGGGFTSADDVADAIEREFTDAR